MGPSRRRFSEKTREPSWVQDWVDAELVERVEEIEAQIARLDVQRAELETEFFERIEVIEAQVESLDNERDRLEHELDVQWEERRDEQVEATALAPEHEAPSEWLIRTPMSGRSFALLISLVLGPWLVIAAIVWLLFG
jgi:chromosome segregation ATPase